MNIGMVLRFMTYSHFFPAIFKASSIVRLGLILFLLALGIVLWPKSQKAHLFTPIGDSEVEAATTDPRGQDVDPFQAVTLDQKQLRNEKLPEPQASYSDSDTILDGQSRDLLSLVVDGTLRFSKREMPAYWDLFRRSANVSYQTLNEKANAKARFNDFYSHPARCRGELFSLPIVVRRVIRYPVEAEHTIQADAVYEIWGSTEQSQTWLYVFLTDKLPDGYNEETLVRTKADFAGYFLKLLAYHPGSAAPNAKPLLAPLLIGKLNAVHMSSVETERASTSWRSRGLTVAIFVTAAYCTIRMVVYKKSRKRISQEKRISLRDFD